MVIRISANTVIELKETSFLVIQRKAHEFLYQDVDKTTFVKAKDSLWLDWLLYIIANLFAQAGGVDNPDTYNVLKVYIKDDSKVKIYRLSGPIYKNNLAKALSMINSHT